MRFAYVAGVSFVLLVAAGCGETVTKVESVDGLKKVADAYKEAIVKLKRPPKNVEELQPFLKKHGDADKLLVSPNDQEPYVILWGTDPNKGRDLKPGVIAYEKKGVGGKRYVYTAMGVMLMDEADFRTANFPKDHKPE